MSFSPSISAPSWSHFMSSSDTEKRRRAHWEEQWCFKAFVAQPNHNLTQHCTVFLQREIERPHHTHFSKALDRMLTFHVESQKFPWEGRRPVFLRFGQNWFYSCFDRNPATPCITITSVSNMDQSWFWIGQNPTFWFMNRLFLLKLLHSIISSSLIKNMLLPSCILLITGISLWTDVCN